MTQPTVSIPTPLSEHGRRTLAIASLAVLAIFLDTTVLFVAFGDIARSFPTVSAADLSWVLNAYTITFAAVLVPAGKIADRIGHKRAFLFGSTAFTLASLLCGVAPTVPALVGFRVLQAVGGALLVPSSLALVLRAFPHDRIPVAVSIWGAAGAVAGALGPTLGATLVEFANWRWVFLLNLPVGLFAVAAGARWLQESRDASSRIPSPVGVVLIAAAAALLSLGVVQTESWGWLDARTAAAIGAGVLLTAVLVLHQRRTSAPVLDLELFESSNYRWANAATVAFALAFTAMFLGSILFLSTAWHWSILRAGLGVSPGPLLVAALAMFIGRVAARVGQKPLLIVGGLSFAAGGLWRVLALQPEPHYLTAYLPSMLLTGIGVSFCLPQLSSTVAQSLPPNRLGVGGASNQAFRQFGGTLGVAITIATLGRPETAAEAFASFDRIWWLFAAGGLLTSLLSLPLHTRPQQVPEQVAVPNAAAPVSTEA